MDRQDHDRSTQICKELDHACKELRVEAVAAQSAKALALQEWTMRTEALSSDLAVSKVWLGSMEWIGMDADLVPLP